MKNDPPISSQAQEITVPATTTKEAHTPDLASDLNKVHQEVETVGPGSTDTDDQSESPDETNYENYPKDKTEHENNQSFQDEEEEHQLSSESPNEKPLDLEPTCSPNDKVGREDALFWSSSAALPEEVNSGPGVSQEPPAIDPQGTQSPAFSPAAPESQSTVRRRLLAPGERAHWTSVLYCSITSIGQGPSFQRISFHRIKAFGPCPRSLKER